MAAKRKSSQKGSHKNQPGLVAITVGDLVKRVGMDATVRVSRVSLREIAFEAAQARLDKL